MPIINREQKKKEKRKRKKNKEITWKIEVDKSEILLWNIRLRYKTLENYNDVNVLSLYGFILQRKQTHWKDFYFPFSALVWYVRSENPSACFPLNRRNPLGFSGILQPKANSETCTVAPSILALALPNKYQ